MACPARAACQMETEKQTPGSGHALRRFSLGIISSPRRRRRHGLGTGRAADPGCGPAA